MPQVANLGIVRPPLVYLSSIALGLVLHLVWPARLVAAASVTLMGAVVAFVGVAVFILSVREMRAAGTPVPGNKPTVAIVCTGPYEFSRNPIYLAFTLFQFGLALWINSAGLMIMLFPAVALMHSVVIPREERYLEERFESEYRRYKASVRRWV